MDDPLAFMLPYRQDVEIATREYERSLADIGGCGNHGCLVVKPTGMATNGPCKCWADKFVTQRVMVAARRLHTRLRELNPIAK